jgi:hypothetical protein
LVNEIFMKSDFYAFTHDESCCYFEFLSRGNIKTDRKVVIYSPTESDSRRYNLCLGHVLPNGDLCDLTVTNNGDMDKIVSTVIRTIAVFLSKDQSRSVYFTGSTPVRTRLYRAIISREFHEAGKYYEIYGVIKAMQEPFRPNVDYMGFLITLKRT